MLIRIAFAAALTAVSLAAGSAVAEPAVVGARVAPADTLPPWARRFIGQWGCAGAFASGKPLAADLAFAPALGARWLEFEHVDRAPGRYEARALWGVFPADTTKLVAVYHDNFGGQRRFLSDGWRNDAVVFERDSTEPGARAERFSYRSVNDSTLHFRWDLRRQAAGPWVLGDSLTCRRS